MRDSGKYWICDWSRHTHRDLRLRREHVDQTCGKWGPRLERAISPMFAGSNSGNSLRSGYQEIWKLGLAYSYLVASSFSHFWLSAPAIVLSPSSGFQMTCLLVAASAWLCPWCARHNTAAAVSPPRTSPRMIRSGRWRSAERNRSRMVTAGRFACSRRASKRTRLLLSI